MANKTFFNLVQQILRLHGEIEYADATAFDSGPHEKTQLQLKGWVSLIHQWLGQTPRSRFLLRDFTFNTADGDNDYDLDATTNYERILEDSFFITTTGHEFGPMPYVDIFKYRMEYPANDETEGAPTRWFLRLKATTAGADHIGFSPPPDATYAIRYSAFIKPTQLSLSTDEIAFTPEWEHVLILWCGTFLEIAKAQGKSQDYGQFIQQLKNELEQHTVPVAGGEYKRIDPIISIYGRSAGGSDLWQSGYHEFENF